MFLMAFLCLFLNRIICFKKSIISWIICTFIGELQEILIYSGNKTFVKYMICNYFLPFPELLFHLIIFIEAQLKNFLWWYSFICIFSCNLCLWHHIKKMPIPRSQRFTPNLSSKNFFTSSPDIYFCDPSELIFVFGVSRASIFGIWISSCPTTICSNTMFSH